jgi:septal ring factor EnvC (AmiA/AmiB activator)
VRFILRHYPIRGQAHGERKVFQERRFLGRERARGWHVQYDAVREGASFIRDPSTLTPYDPDAMRLALTLRHRDVEALEASLDEVRSLVEAQRRGLEVCQEELVRTRAELATRSAEAAALRDDFERRTTELAETGAEIARLRDSLEKRAAEIERWRAAVEDGVRRLDAFEQSLSWRLTSPARTVYRLLRGR